MDREELTAILTQVLTSDERWWHEVERNVMLQKNIDDLFNCELFQLFLEYGVLPKFKDTNLPHFRAIELICAFRELAAQIHEGGADHALVERELEDLELRFTDKWGTGTRIEINQELPAALSEAKRIVQLYQEEPQFSARLDRFRLLVLPLCIKTKEKKLYQKLIAENTRPPRRAWTPGKK